MAPVNIGTAGWSIPRELAAEFPTEGSVLERYAARFPVVEINSSFHRPHRPGTWARWHDSTPEGFRFSVKLPKSITHERKLVEVEGPLAEFLGQVSHLGGKLAVMLVQLPPKLSFDPDTAGRFFAALGSRSMAAIACEPRHPSWFTDAADALLSAQRVARVGSDPAVCHAAASPGPWGRLRYWRLHGSPRIYRSSYAERLPQYATLLEAEARQDRDVWCIFDNTASSAAARDALSLRDLTRARPVSGR